MSAAFCAVVPAAGAGLRMGAATPKQYLALEGATVIEWALAPLLAARGLARLVVALAPGDDTFAGLAPAGDPRVRLATGGATRADSVRAGLAALTDVGETTPVLVHDAARPCLGAGDLESVRAVAGEPAGGLLAVPVCDTLKRDDDRGRVAATVARAGLWQALTPQGFPLGLLRRALDETAGEAGITDEASAVERLGHAPRLIRGDPRNIKITQPDHLALAAAILRSRRGEHA